MPKHSIYSEHLGQCAANYVPLSPLGFLERARAKTL